MVDRVLAAIPGSRYVTPPAEPADVSERTDVSQPADSDARRLGDPGGRAGPDARPASPTGASAQAAAAVCGGGGGPICRRCRPGRRSGRGRGRGRGPTASAGAG
jgi:hypothetical protein